MVDHLHPAPANTQSTTDNCFLTNYHPSFMVHWWVLLVHSGQAFPLYILLVQRIIRMWTNGKMGV
jgi:hypothetical protein